MKTETILNKLLSLKDDNKKRFTNSRRCLGYAYQTTINGAFNIYSYDCDNPAVDEPCKTLDGKYFTYYYDGFVAFVEY